MLIRKEAFRLLSVLLLFAILLLPVVGSASDTPIRIGSSLQLFVDEFIIEEFRGGAHLRLHHPVAQEIVFTTSDFPWEGSSTAYGTVFQDGDLYRMYYRTSTFDMSFNVYPRIHSGPSVYAYAESTDGINWTKPNLGLVKFDDIEETNIFWRGPQFAPFKDTNPDAPPEAQYKAMADSPMFAYQSPDGVTWEKMQEEPVITQGEFGSLNIAFWDSASGVYRAYWRDRHLMIRTISTATSEDFINWTEPQRLVFHSPDGEPAPNFHLYKQGILPYYRNPQILIGFPDVYIDQEWPEAMALDVNPGYAMNDPAYNPQHKEWLKMRMHRSAAAIRNPLFMSSRDGVNFYRWNEAFLRPGPEQRAGWGYYGSGAFWGIVETQSQSVPDYRELSIYTVESSGFGSLANIRRHTIRIDGFVSAYAPYRGGEIITKPLIFHGNYMVINFATSAQGSIQIEILDERGQPIPGLELVYSPLIRGDHLERTVTWRDPEGGKERTSDLSHLAGRPIRLRFVLKDADLYSFRFVTR